jgi:hypothetical protein
MFQTHQIAATRGFNSVCVQNLQKGIFKTYKLNLGDDNLFKSQLKKSLSNLKLGSEVFYSDKSDVYKFDASSESNLTFPFHFQSVYLMGADSLKLLDHILNKLKLTAHSICVYQFEENTLQHLNKIIMSSNIHQISFIDCNPDMCIMFESNYIVECIISDEQKNEVSFVNNISYYIECQNFNPATYKKLFLLDGKAYVDPWYSIELNNLDSDRQNVIDTLENGFFIYSSTKQKTAICCDCEYRNMCYDLKKPIWNKITKLWYHQTECNYNPYIAKWKGEEGYRTLAECGIISNENEFSIDHEKIAEINKELWGEDQ